MLRPSFGVCCPIPVTTTFTRTAAGLCGPGVPASRLAGGLVLPRLGAGFLFGCCFPPGASCFDPAYLPSNRYLKFCGESGICALPVCEWSLCFFVAHLHRAVLSSHIVKSYLSAVCHTQVSMGLGDSSVFLFSDGRMLTRVRLVSTLHSALQETGIDDSRFSGHSFRIGAATTAALQGVPDSLIKTVSRWESAAYQLFIRTPTETVCGVSRTLVQ